jgi:hypothetical protein
MTDGYWTINFTENDDRWDLDYEYPTKEEAIRKGKSILIADGELHARFRVGKINIPVFEFDGILDTIKDYYYDECGEVAENYDIGEYYKLLEKLNQIFQEHEKEFGDKNFCGIDYEQTIKIDEE